MRIASWALCFLASTRASSLLEAKLNSRSAEPIRAETPKGESSQITATDVDALVFEFAFDSEAVADDVNWLRMCGARE